MAAVHGPVVPSHATSRKSAPPKNRISTQSVPQASAGSKSQDPFYGHGEVAGICARFVSHLFACSDLPPSNLPVKSSQQARLPYFIAYALHRTRLHQSVTFAALVLLQRLKARFPTAKGSSGHRLFISAFMIASKSMCDDTYSNKSWSIVAQGLFSLREINQMEREFCSYLEWELSVTEPILSTFTKAVRRDFGPNSSTPYPTYSLTMVSRRAARAAVSTSVTPLPEPSETTNSIPTFGQQRNATPVKGQSPVESPPKKKRGSSAPKPIDLPGTDSVPPTPPHSYSASTTPTSSPSPRTPVDAEDISVKIDSAPELVLAYQGTRPWKNVSLKQNLYSRPAPAFW